MFGKKSVVFNKTALLALLITVTLMFTGCGGSSTPDKAQSSEILIGVSAAITGPSPFEGERTKQGIELAIQEINNNGGVLGKKLRAVIEDDQNTANIAVNTANKLSSQNIVAIIGPHRSGNASAVSDIMQKNKIPFFTGGTSPTLLKLNNPYLFRVRASDSIVAKIAAKFAVEKLKGKKVGLMYNNDEYGTGAKSVMEDYLKSINVALISEGHNTGDKDMTGQIMKMKNSGVDVLILWTHVPEGSVAFKQLKQLNMNVPIIAGPGYTNETFYRLVDAATIEGAYTVTDFIDSNPDPKVQAYVKNFKAKYNADAEIYAACYYDAVFALADAIKRANSTDREAIRKALTETKGLKGVMSTMSSNDKGELVHEVIIAQIKNKVAIMLETIKE